MRGKQPVPKKKRDEGVGVGFQTYREHDFHKSHFGEPKDVEYHDLVPLFKAENYNAEDWADLFFMAGAKFAGPVAMHHDGYAMWDSKITPWNAANSGPEVDILGTLSKSIKKRGMKLITTFHHAKVGRYDDTNPNVKNTAGIIMGVNVTCKEKHQNVLVLILKIYRNYMVQCLGMLFVICGTAY